VAEARTPTPSSAKTVRRSEQPNGQTDRPKDHRQNGQQSRQAPSNSNKPTDSQNTAENTTQASGRDWTVLEVLTWTTARFSERKLDSPRLDAELLVGHALGGGRMSVYTRSHDLLDKDTLARLRTFIQRRQHGEPVAYIIGQKSFWTLDLAVDARVLVPRPETETVVEEAQERLATFTQITLQDTLQDTTLLGTQTPAADSDTPQRAADASTGPTATSSGELSFEPEPDRVALSASGSGDDLQPTANTQASEARAPTPKQIRIVDVGTGSGALALTLKKLYPQAHVRAFDLSQDALDVATQNAQTLGLEVDFAQGDLLAPACDNEAFALIVANLPYIPTRELKTLSAEVQHEPRSALDGGADGLDLVRKLTAQARRHLQPGGSLILEIGAGQHEATEQILAQNGFTLVRTRADLAGIGRVVSGCQPAVSSEPTPGSRL